MDPENYFQPLYYPSFLSFEALPDMDAMLDMLPEPYTEFTLSQFSKETVEGGLGEYEGKGFDRHSNSWNGTFVPVQGPGVDTFLEISTGMKRKLSDDDECHGVESTTKIPRYDPELLAEEITRNEAEWTVLDSSLAGTPRRRNSPISLPNGLDMSSLQSINDITDNASTVAVEDDTSETYTTDSADSDETTEAAVAQHLAREAGENKRFDSQEDVEVVRKHGPKPDFSLDSIKNNPMKSMLDDFLAKMADANEQLEADKAAGKELAGGFEINGDEDGEGSGQYIEMNLGLGVLEEKGDDASTSEDTSSSESGEGEVLGKLMDVQSGAERKGKKAEERKVVIEEL